MIYQGSKARLIKDILPYIQNCIDSNKVNLYIEPFVGGANVIQHIKKATKIGLDTNKYLIALLKHCQNNPDLTDAFEDCPFELYKEVRDSYNKGDDRYEDWQKGLVGFCASYGGQFFDGGYGRDKTGKRNIYIRKESSILKMRLKALWECLSQCRTTLPLTAMPKRLLLLSSILTHLTLVRNNTRITSGTTSSIAGLGNSQNTISCLFQNIKCRAISCLCGLRSVR